MPGSKYFRLCMPNFGLSCNYSTLSLQCISSRKQYVKEGLWPCSVNKMLFTETGRRMDLACGFQFTDPWSRKVWLVQYGG